MQFESNFLRAKNVQDTPNQVTIGCTMLAGTDKKGILAPNKDGYYTVVLGAYGAYNSAGMFYEESSGLSMFAPDSPLMRRLRKGVLYMEFKHPEPYKPDGSPMNDSEYMQRIRKIDDDRVCAHISELTIVNSFDEKGRPIKLVIGEVIPYGPFKQIFLDSLNNPRINTYCSVRSITQDDTMRGIKYTREISTWDFVGEGGIYVANKYNSPALEEFKDATMIINPATLWKMDTANKNRRKLGLECDENQDVTRLLEELNWVKRPSIRVPIYAR